MPAGSIADRNHIAMLEQTTDEYRLVEKMFRKGWKHSRKPKPAVQAVFRVFSTEESLGPYRAYRASVAESLPPNAFRGNETFLFHGSNRACFVGEGDNCAQLCSFADCGICSIVQYSFDIKKTGSKHKFQRFGTGIYTSPCSSKADDYSANLDGRPGPQVLLVCRVVVGKALEKRKNETDRTEVPLPYHSLLGKPGPALNFPEIVVYRNDAVRPAYLIVYRKSQV